MNPPKSYRLVFDPKRVSGYSKPLMIIGVAIISLLLGRFLFGSLLFLSAVLWLFERNEFQIYRMLMDKEPQLVLRPSGIDIVQKRKSIFVKWKNINELRLGVRRMDGDDKNNELYVYTQSQGNMCLPIDQLSIKSLESFREKLDEWWAWARAERVRKAMGGH